MYVQNNQNLQAGGTSLNISGRLPQINYANGRRGKETIHDTIPSTHIQELRYRWEPPWQSLLLARSLVFRCVPGGPSIRPLSPFYFPAGWCLNTAMLFTHCLRTAWPTTSHLPQPHFRLTPRTHAYYSCLLDLLRFPLSSVPSSNLTPLNRAGMAFPLPLAMPRPFWTTATWATALLSMVSTRPCSLVSWFHHVDLLCSFQALA